MRERICLELLRRWGRIEEELNRTRNRMDKMKDTQEQDIAKESICRSGVASYNLAAFVIFDVYGNECQ